MIVWLPRTDAGARPTPYPTLATTATVTASVPTEGRARARVRSTTARSRASSDDPSSYFDWWPTRRQRDRVGRDDVRQAGERSRKSSVYWFDDTGQRRGARAGGLAAALQGRRRLEAGRGRGGTASRAIATTGVTFKPVTTERAAARGDDAAGRLGRRAGVEGEVDRCRCATTWSRPRRTARRTAAVRLCAPSLPVIDATWNFTVWSLMPSRAAMPCSAGPRRAARARRSRAASALPPGGIVGGLGDGGRRQGIGVAAGHARLRQLRRFADMDSAPSASRRTGRAPPACRPG